MFEIICGNDFLFDGGIFTCTFYCRTETDAFPDAAWTDFAATVLDGWADALLAVADRKQAGFRLLFADGPFRIDGVKTGERAALSFCRWGGDFSSARTLFTAEFPFAELLEAVRKAALRLCSALFLAGYGEDARKARARALTKPTNAKIAPIKKKPEAIFASGVSCTCILRSLTSM